MRILPSVSSVMNRQVGSDEWIHHFEVQPVSFGDRAPVIDACPAEGVRTDPDSGIADRVDVEDTGEVFDVVAEEVVAFDAVQRLCRRHTPYPGKPLAQKLVRSICDNRRRIRVRGPTVRRVVFEATVTRRIV